MAATPVLVRNIKVLQRMLGKRSLSAGVFMACFITFTISASHIRSRLLKIYDSASLQHDLLDLPTTRGSAAASITSRYPVQDHEFDLPIAKVELPTPKKVTKSSAVPPRRRTVQHALIDHPTRGTSSTAIATRHQRLPGHLPFPNFLPTTKVSASAAKPPRRQTVQQVNPGSIGPTRGIASAATATRTVGTVQQVNPGSIGPQPFKPILPNILIIGAQKAGSTALSDWLFSNKVCGGKIAVGEPTFYRKEMHFFSNDKRYARGKEFYKRRYAHCSNRKNRLRLDATPTTMQHPDRVYETYKRVRNISKLRIVVSLREPVARELSLYNHQLSQFNRNPSMDEWYSDVAHPNGTAKTFEEFVETVTIPNLENPHKSSSLAHYAKFLQRWYQLFEPQQILVLSYQNDIRTSNAAKKKLKRFLGYPFNTEGPFPVTNTHASSAKVKQISCRVRDRLHAIFEPWNQELYQLLKNYSMPTKTLTPGSEEDRRPREPFPEFELAECVEDDTTQLKEKKEKETVETVSRSEEVDTE